MNFDSILVVSSIVILCMIYLQYTGYLQNTSKIVTTKHDRSDNICDQYWDITSCGSYSNRSKNTIPGSGDENNICYNNFKNEKDCNNTLVKSNDSNLPLYHVCEWHDDGYGCITKGRCTTCN